MNTRGSAMRRGRTYMLTRCSCVNDYLTDTFTNITPTFDTDIIFARNLYSMARSRVSLRLIAPLVNYESYECLYSKSRRKYV